MKVSFGLPWMAPQTTGHPNALPPDPPVTRSDKKVAAAAGQSGTAGTARRDREEASAPPSAMQRKITELLESQAKNITTPDSAASADDEPGAT